MGDIIDSPYFKNQEKGIVSWLKMNVTWILITAIPFFFLSGIFIGFMLKNNKNKINDNDGKVELLMHEV